jgi:hypothetical protein
MTSRYPITLLAAAGLLALGACNKGCETAGARDTAALSLPAGAPAATPAAYSEDKALAYDGYALAERAHSFDRSVHNRRPDYAFRYDDEQPLAWRTADDYAMYAEPYEGGYRNYYYAPHADHPYFVRDGSYGYGYGPDGRVRAVYDSRGALVTGDRFAQLVTIAADVYLRAHTVRRYGEDSRYRVAVNEPDWAQRSRTYSAAQSTWIAAPERQPQWREWRQSHRQDLVEFEAPPVRHDNGLHLGWAKQERKAERRGDDRFAVAYSREVRGVPAADVVVVRADDGGPHEGKGHGKGKHGGDEPGHDEGHGHGNGHGRGHDKD